MEVCSVIAVLFGIVGIIGGPYDFYAVGKFPILNRSDNNTIPSLVLNKISSVFYNQITNLHMPTVFSNTHLLTSRMSLLS